MIRLACIALSVVFLLAPLGTAENALAPRLRAALVRLHVTSQSFDETSPWNKSRPRTTTSRGVVVQPGVILTRASNVQDPLMIEVSVANSARRYPARLKHIDPRVGLALVEITDEELKARMQPLPVGEPVKLDDEFDLYQLGVDNMVERYTARVVRADASGSQLRLRLKTTCSDAGDGQVALRDGRIVGLVTATNRSRQEGTILGVETIRRYLGDLEDGSYAGAPGSGLWIQPLLRDDLRTYAGVGADRHGVMVTRVMPGRTGDGVLQPRDVLVEVDGFALDDEGMFRHPLHGRLHASYLFQGRHDAGTKVPAEVLREGKILDAELELRTLPETATRVPRGSGSERPQFLVVGGAVVLELNKRNLSRVSRSPGGVIIRRFNERANWDMPDGRRRMVYLDRVLTDVTNKGYEQLRHAPIRSVNGQPIHEIADVAKALETPEGEFHVFRFDGLESDFVVPAARLEEINKRVAETYKVTLLRNLH